MTPQANAARFRIWPAENTEPHTWLCTLDTRQVDPGLARLPAGSFGLFQFGGHVTTWSDIEVRALDVNHGLIDELLQSRPRHVAGMMRKIQKAIFDRLP